MLEVESVLEGMLFVVVSEGCNGEYVLGKGVGVGVQVLGKSGIGVGNKGGIYGTEV